MKGCVAKVPWKFKIVGALCFYSLVMFAYMPSTDRLLCAVAMFVSAVGALLFLISDVCLGLNRVAGMKAAYKFVWILYPIGQFLLITCG